MHCAYSTVIFPFPLPATSLHFFFSFFLQRVLAAQLQASKKLACGWMDPM